MRARLAGLQWRIDIERERAGTPLAASVRLSRMMWDNVTGPYGLLEQLQSLEDTTVRRPSRPAAEVLPLSPANKPDSD
jgi:hypothetical protein